jgi:hypothetical protein
MEARASGTTLHSPSTGFGEGWEKIKFLLLGPTAQAVVVCF